MIMDNASQHKTGKVRRYPEQNPDVRILYLPVARPEIGTTEEIWRQAKYRLLTSESYRTLDDLRRAVSEHLRTCSINVDIHTYLARSVWDEIIFGRRYRTRKVRQARPVSYRSIRPYRHRCYVSRAFPHRICQTRCKDRSGQTGRPGTGQCATCSFPDRGRSYTIPKCGFWVRET